MRTLFLVGVVEVLRIEDKWELATGKVRLILNDGKQAGFVDLQEALRLARAAKLDLLHVNSNEKSNNVVCKILDYNSMMRGKKKIHDEALVSNS